MGDGKIPTNLSWALHNPESGNPTSEDGGVPRREQCDQANRKSGFSRTYVHRENPESKAIAVNPDLSCQYQLTNPLARLRTESQPHYFRSRQSSIGEVFAGPRDHSGVLIGTYPRAPAAVPQSENLTGQDKAVGFGPSRTLAIARVSATRHPKSRPWVLSKYFEWARRPKLVADAINTSQAYWIISSGLFRLTVSLNALEFFALAPAPRRRT